MQGVYIRSLERKKYFVFCVTKGEKMTLIGERMWQVMITYIYERYKQDVFQYLMSLTHDKVLSEDLTSETFLSAIKSIMKFKGKSDIKTWLFSIARYKWYEHLRKHKATVSMEDLAQMYLLEMSSVESKIMKAELIRRALELLEKETERNREIVLMRIEGYSFYEIARKYHISESSARVIDFRTKQKLKEALLKEGLTYE